MWDDNSRLGILQQGRQKKQKKPNRHDRPQKVLLCQPTSQYGIKVQTTQNHCICASALQQILIKPNRRLPLGLSCERLMIKIKNKKKI